MIPAFDSNTGTLPRGRYTCSLGEVQDRLVEDPVFADSVSRSRLFGGLVRYLLDWELAADTTESAKSLLRSFWLAGSFASVKLDPGDVDITPIVDGPAADAVKGRMGSRAIRDLTQHRAGIEERYGLEVFPLRWYPVERPHRADGLAGELLAYTSDRGKLDDWWERCRVDGSDVPSIEGCDSRRGYLEVRL